MKSNVFLVSMLVLIVLAGCANKEEVAKELIDYNNNVHLEVEKMKKDLEIVINKLPEIEKESNEEAAFFVEEEILPKTKEIINYLESVKPEHPEIKKLHKIKYEGEMIVYQGVIDGGEYYQGNLNESQILVNTIHLTEKYDEFLEERTSLMEKYNVVFEEDSDTGYGMRVKLKEDE